MHQELDIIDVPVISAAFRQLGIFVLDGSGSMTDPVQPAGGGSKSRPKCQEVSISVRELLTRFKVSRKAPNFSFGLVTFNDSVTFEGPVTALVDIDDNGNYDPTASGVGGTFIGSGLEAAGRMAKGFLADTSSGLPSSVVILTMSDGECAKPDVTASIADGLKADPNISIAAAFFATKGGGSSAGHALLQEICSDPATMYKTVYDAETLRKFFEASMTAAASMAGIETDSQR